MGLALTMISCLVAFVVALIGTIRNHRPEEGEKSYIGGVNSVGLSLIILSFISLAVGIGSAVRTVESANEARHEAEARERELAARLEEVKKNLDVQNSRVEDYHVRRAPTRIATRNYSNRCEDDHKGHFGLAGEGADPQNFR